MSLHRSLTEAGEILGTGVVVPFLAMGDDGFNSRIKVVWSPLQMRSICPHCLEGGAWFNLAKCHT